MKRLDRLIYKELLVPFLIGTLTVLLLFQANYLIFLFKTYSPSSVPWTATAQMLLFESPKWFSMALTMGTSLATALALSRLARESEVTAIRSLGIPILRIMRPVFIFGLSVSLLSYVVSEFVQPIASKSSRKLASEVFLKGSLPDFTSNVTVKLGNRIAIIGTVSRVAANRVALNHVLLYERPNDEETTLTIAKSGTYQDGIWKLDDPKSWMFQSDSLLKMASKEQMEILEPVTIDSMFAPAEPEELTAKEIGQQIVDLKKQGADPRRLEIALAERVAVPASCAVLAIISPLFAIYYYRSGAFFGVLLGVLVTMAYYNFYIVSTKVLGPNGMVSPWLSAWLTNIVFGIIGLFGVRKLE